ncbi:MAG: 3-deoxy-7-phosphoheptulonate synthase, partial [Intestinibacter bartlettii]|nr:3-deoxy-7-phosphoheptulonate synthase [Intestinibacter bartlettii]
MIIVLKIGYTEAELNEILEFLQVRGLRVTVSHGKQMCVIGVIGDITRIDSDELLAYSYVEKVMNVTEPYKKANRLFHPADTIVDVNGSKVGGKYLGIMAGPCSVESEKQIVEVAKAVKASGANFLRGGAFKPRTSPYSFQGLELEGLELLKI